MSKKITAGHTIVKFKGEYDWDGLYKLITQWVLNRRYIMQEGRYKNKKLSSAGNEIQLTIIGEKKETAYTKLWIDIYIHSWDLKEKQVVVDGKKKLMTGGRFSIEITTDIEFDWQNKYTDSKFKEAMGKLYYWLMKKEFENIYIDAQEYEALKLEHEIKKFLKMETDTNAY